MRTSWRRALASITITAALAAAGVPAAHAAAQKASIKVTADGTQPVFSYQDAIREYVNVQSSVDSDGDGKKDLIRVDIIRPKESDEGLKVPVIMDESPYYDNLGRGNESERKTYDTDGDPAKFPLYYDNYFVPRGYAVLEVDMDGTTKSDGCPTSGGASDVLGGKAVVDWLNGRAKAFDADGRQIRATWTNGRTAMIGKSYDGTLANAVAATGVQGLETIVPISAISSWYDYSRMNGTLLARGEEDGLADTVDTDPPAKCAAVQQQLAAGQDDATGDYNAFWAERDYRDGTVADVRRVHAAVFAVQGLNDLNVKPSQFSTWWSALAQQGVPRKVWLSQYGHVDPFDYRRDAWVDTLHQWFDHWLWRIPNDIMRQPRADVETGPDQWATQQDWPAPGATPVTLRPQADGSLGLHTDSGTGTYTDTLVAEDTAVAAPETTAPGRLAYTTPPLAHDLRISGTPEVSLSVRLDKPTANLGALLVDYGTGTRINYLGAGEGVRTLGTEDCHGESTTVDDACYRQVVTDTVTSDVNVVARGYTDAQNRLSLSRPAPLTPGKAYSVKWDTLPQDYTFKAGHRLALVLIGTDSDVQSDRATGATVSVDLAGSGITLPAAPPARSAAAGTLFAPQRDWQGPTRVDLPRPHRSFR
ncbi:X-Pro dipeptidyl-peptidase [Streptomyces sulfonofaciens]|uniref:Xaa-Pro dipeptidyl-peptidase n=1 Tax=Streptomyces sulfonofaciens TaxID=68272 RepID=A0A919LD52_9ACTN|nr:Xaa-Pro dipeptidyl-peptidase [Streptomyces sulfonofaciens]GHH88946.1 X-Pro dipeptidyl-peptidase [Streptomyces sulfonofaciens]